MSSLTIFKIASKMMEELSSNPPQSRNKFQRDYPSLEEMNPHEILAELSSRFFWKDVPDPYAPGVIPEIADRIRYQSCLSSRREQRDGNNDFGYERCEALRKLFFERIQQSPPPSSEELGFNRA